MKMESKLKMQNEGWFEGEKREFVARLIVCFSSIIIMLPHVTIIGCLFYLVGLLILWKTGLPKNQKWLWSFFPLLAVGIIYKLLDLMIYCFDKMDCFS